MPNQSSPLEGGTVFYRMGFAVKNEGGLGGHSTVIVKLDGSNIKNPSKH